MDPATLEKLEFPRVTEALAGLCATALGKELARSAMPSGSLTMVRRWLAQVQEMTSLEPDIGLPPLAGVRDIRGDLQISGRPAGLEPDVLANVAETLAATQYLCAWLARLDEHSPNLMPFKNRVGDFTSLARQINLAIDPRGHLLDSASDKLNTIRRTIEKARSQINAVIDRLLRQSSVQRILQYGNATFHNDRTVLPLKSEHRGRIKGIIHRSSDSGATLFVEPAEAVELNNSIVRLKQSEQKEITRILQVLSRMIHENAPEIGRTLRALAVLDLIAAKQKFAILWHCTCPEIRDDGAMYLHQARHPVLLQVFAAEHPDRPRDVVPIDVRLGDDFDLLVITGPNTGGKTATLKTIGLMAAMNQAGIPIPAGPGTSMPVYRKMFIDVGDEQSLEQSLSTFSGHMANILNLLSKAGPGSLVLIDELGAGTDPDEGAAIGRAIMEELLRLKTKAVVTTHLSVLKGMAFTHERADNAAVEFDVKTLRPTYRLLLGEPGNSNAIIVADRLGMPQRLVDRARHHLDDQHRHLNRAIEGTLRSRRLAETARNQALEAKLAAEQSKANLEQQRQKLIVEQNEYTRWIAWINGLKPGDPVYVRTFETTGKIVRMHLQKQTALISAGAMDYEIQLRDLTTPPEEDAA